MTGNQRETHVLVVDDNGDMRLSLRLLLERAGYDVSLAAGGAQALRIQASHPARVLITDIFMPEMDGLEVIRHFRQDFADVKIVAISGGGDQSLQGDYLTTAQHAGADVALRKPFESASLLEAVRRLRDTWGPEPRQPAVS